MGSKGVLLSNYQQELAEYFEDGLDVIMYSSMEEAVDKADFYLRNEELRKQIAMNGYQKVKDIFTYPACIQRMLDSI